MKLISLNMEGERRLPLVTKLIEQEQADTLCLTEAPGFFTEILHKLGYSWHFAPMLGRNRSGMEFIEGIIVASRQQMTAHHEFYFRMAEKIVTTSPGEPEVISFPVCFANIQSSEGLFEIAAVHLPVTPNGQTDKQQIDAVNTLLSILETKPSHSICGDFNIPRGYNALYQKFCEHYQDEIPQKYSSSLDKNLHRLGSDPNLDEPIFEKFMVDYIFTQKPYSARNVRLEFGVSDHAAVIGTITKQT